MERLILSPSRVLKSGRRLWSPVSVDLIILVGNGGRLANSSSGRIADVDLGYGPWQKKYVGI